jgi:hypothetical protein
MERTSSIRLILSSIDSPGKCACSSPCACQRSRCRLLRRYPGVESVYSWNSTIEESAEVLLIKTTDEMLERCEQLVRSITVFLMEMI